MPDPIRFSVPLTPPTGNLYVRHTRAGRHYRSRATDKFYEAVKIFARGAKIEAESYRVSVRIVLGPRQRGDVDNFLKCSLDSLVSAGVIHSDDAILSLTAEKVTNDRGNPRTEFEIGAL